MGIDQSLSGTGISVVESQDSPGLDHVPGLARTIRHLETTKCALTGMPRLDFIARKIISVATEFNPTLICMEDVTRMASSASLIPLVELYAVIKFSLWHESFPLRIQNQSQMKKFNFGQGNVSKDSTYMLRVFDATGERFLDDNQADAFMHANLGMAVVRLLAGQTALTNYTVPQQEVLLAEAFKASQLTQGKFKKLAQEEKMKLVLKSALLA